SASAGGSAGGGPPGGWPPPSTPCRRCGRARAGTTAPPSGRYGPRWGGSASRPRPPSFLAEDGPDRGVGRRPAEVVGEGPARVGDDPHVQHLRRVPVVPGCRVAEAAQLDAEAGDGGLAAPAHDRG